MSYFMTFECPKWVSAVKKTVILSYAPVVSADGYYAVPRFFSKLDIYPHIKSRLYYTAKTAHNKARDYYGSSF